MVDSPSHSMLARAAGRLSHEIRNSVAGVAGALDVLQDRIAPAPEATEVIDRIRVEVARIESWVTELAMFAQPAVPVLRRRNVHEIIDRALHRAPLVATTRVTRCYGEEVPPARIDEKLLAEALLRLFLNAQQAMPAGGTLEIVTAMRDDHIYISVLDTGKGIGGEELPTVFEPFYSRKTRGLGLGLAIVRQLVEAQGGSVALTSSPGAGTELTLILPVG